MEENGGKEGRHTQDDAYNNRRQGPSDLIDLKKTRFIYVNNFYYQKNI